MKVSGHGQDGPGADPSTAMPTFSGLPSPPTPLPSLLSLPLPLFLLSPPPTSCLSPGPSYQWQQEGGKIGISAPGFLLPVLSRDGFACSQPAKGFDESLMCP